MPLSDDGALPLGIRVSVPPNTVCSGRGAASTWALRTALCSYAPMSQATPAGRLYARWSLSGQSAPVYRSTAGLPGSSARVCVGPPLLASGASNGFVFERSELWRWQAVPDSRFAPGTVSLSAAPNAPDPVLTAQFWAAGTLAMITPVVTEKIARGLLKMMPLPR